MEQSLDGRIIGGFAIAEKIGQFVHFLYRL